MPYYILKPLKKNATIIKVLDRLRESPATAQEISTDLGMNMNNVRSLLSQYVYVHGAIKVAGHSNNRGKHIIYALNCEYREY